MKGAVLTYLTLVLAIANLNLFSQKETTSRNALDDQYSPKGSIFQQGKSPSRGGGGEREEISDVIKFYPVDLFRGNIVFENEWNIPGTATNLLFGLGYRAFPGVLEDITLGSEAGSGITLEDAASFGTYNKGGLLYTFGAKFYGNAGWYYNSDANPFYGVYTSLKFEHYKYSYLLNSNVNNIPVTGDRAYNVAANLIHWGIGASTVTRGKIKTYHDLYFGVAAKVTSYSRYMQQYNSSSSYGVSGYTTEYAMQGKSHAISFVFDFGYCIGFAFK